MKINPPIPPAKPKFFSASFYGAMLGALINMVLYDLYKFPWVIMVWLAFTSPAACLWVASSIADVFRLRRETKELELELHKKMRTLNYAYLNIKRRYPDIKLNK